MKLNVLNTHNAKYLAMLPQWKCHKVVQAGKISLMARDEENGQLMIHAEPSNMPFAVQLDFLQRHNPERGGYLVVYEDGYLSYSPADVFEAGYHLLSLRPVDDFPDTQTLKDAGKHTGGADWALEADAAPGMTDISRHPLLTQAYEVCQEIEKCGASPQLTAAVIKASSLLRELDAFIPVTDVAGGNLAQELKKSFLDAWRKAEDLAYQYAHSLPEGDERQFALGIYHRVRLLFSNGKSGMTQDAAVEVGEDEHPKTLLADQTMKLQELCEDYGCPGGLNRFAWLRTRLDALARLEQATRPVNQDGADFSDALVWLKNGQHVRRTGWNGKGLWLEYIEPHTSVDLPFIRLVYPEPGNGSLPYPNGARVPWAPSQTDMLATDWQLVD